MTEKTLTKADLSQFTGTEIWYKYSFVPNVCYTEGVRYVAQAGGAYWLLDEIAFAQDHRDVKQEPFQHWLLEVNPDQSARLSCDDGNDVIVFEKQIECTDFPLDRISLYYTNNVILLPSEY